MFRTSAQTKALNQRRRHRFGNECRLKFFHEEILCGLKDLIRLNRIVSLQAMIFGLLCEIVRVW